ncbi:beta-galactosidase [Alterisphingorhabdus coralli]|uniref:Beta-galactosidase n=1 Tax=Alterisphingorhabdus coralli TaxID=3071408 RepID=A0AA97F4I4_9SPHN|nr:beta-galactosidase [Parasphingorhabdus sp. SCSIO 66989]WOE73891.1 beta-galactosidase [Parasphingorhabdus sp. SCSIO 66989]
MANTQNPVSMALGVCYYPEHWPEEMWPTDFARMKALGISQVRIGEFAWSRLEPDPGRFDWGWLDRVMDIAGDHDLGIILGPPTATPPKWLIDSVPDILAHDRHGQPRRFGSRRHYCFSSENYRVHSRRITHALAERYAQHPALVMWQTDNEYGCHDTVLSYSPMAAQAFRGWLAQRYGSVAALNAAWGNVFWSMEYRSFAEIDLPNSTVTEPNPSHVMDFRRFSSDQVRSFNAEQCAILREHAPDIPISHNFMGHFADFDHHALGRDLDMATWDSYPLGFLDQEALYSAEDKARYRRRGHPDFAAFHHDLYRGCAPKWGVMEQQPGPVNWAPHNAMPDKGMVRLWSWEAFAQGASLLSWFRWRQAPFAQEQMHAGLRLPDDTPAPVWEELEGIADDLERIGPTHPQQAEVAILFDYAAQWMIETQPQGRGFSYSAQAFALYSALRQLGQSIDIIGPDAALTGYKAVFVPSLPHIPEALRQRLAAFDGMLCLFPRCGSKTEALTVVEHLPPGPLKDIIPIRVEQVESLPADMVIAVRHETGCYNAHHWREQIVSDLTPLAHFQDGGGAWYASGNVHYVACWPGPDFMQLVVQDVLQHAGTECVLLPEGVRLRRHGDLRILVNYADAPVDCARYGGPKANADYLLGAARTPPCDLSIWRG